MFRNEQVVRVLKPEHFNAYKLVTNDDRVHPVWKKVLNALQPRKRITVHSDEANVVTEEFNRAS